MPVKKKAAKKSKVPKKRGQYKPRQPKDKLVVEEKPKSRAKIKVAPIEEDGFTLFEVQKYDGPLYRSGFENTKEFKMLEEILQNIKPREQFIIRAEWTRFARDIVKKLDMVTKGGAEIVVRKIPNNEKFVKVARIS